MTYRILSEVKINGIGKVKHIHEQTFSEDSNIFGKILEYHKYMRKTFPGCEFELKEVKEI